MVTDISWDKGQTYLFRDYRKEMKMIGIDTHILLYLLNKGLLSRIETDYCTQFKKLSKNRSISIIQVSSSLADHIFQKNNEPILETHEICNE